MTLLGCPAEWRILGRREVVNLLETAHGSPGFVLKGFDAKAAVTLFTMSGMPEHKGQWIGF